MEFLQPSSLTEALEMKAAHPEAVPIAGGTDVMVEINLDHRRPETVMDLTRVRELAEWASEDGLVRIGAGVPYTRLIDELGDRMPGLAMASRTVGSPPDPQPWHRGWQPRHRLAGRGCAAAAARHGRDGGARF